jgi:hypothetical protein
MIMELLLSLNWSLLYYFYLLNTRPFGHCCSIISKSNLPISNYIKIHQLVLQLLNTQTNRKCESKTHMVATSCWESTKHVTVGATHRTFTPSHVTSNPHKAHPHKAHHAQSVRYEGQPPCSLAFNNIKHVHKSINDGINSQCHWEKSRGSLQEV